MGTAMPLKVGGAQVPFTQQIGGNGSTVSSPVETHIYAKPTAPLPPIPGSGPGNSVVGGGSSVSGSNGGSSVGGWRGDQAHKEPPPSSGEIRNRAFSRDDTVPSVGSAEETDTYSTKVIQEEARQATLPGNVTLNSDSRNV